MAVPPLTYALSRGPTGTGPTPEARVAQTPKNDADPIQQSTHQWSQGCQTEDASAAKASLRPAIYGTPGGGHAGEPFPDQKNGSRGTVTTGSAVRPVNQTHTLEMIGDSSYILTTDARGRVGTPGANQISNG